MSLKELIQQIEHNELHRQALLGQAKKVSKQNADILSNIRKAVKAGESTDDHIRNMVLVVHGLDTELEKKYRALEGLLAGKKGEFVLLSYDVNVPFKFSATSVECRHASFYRIGVLEGEGLAWMDKNDPFTSYSPITLPVSRYLSGKESYFHSGDNTGGVSVRNIFAHAHNHEDPPSLHALMQGEAGGSVVIGDEEVRKWLKEHRMEALFEPAAAALSKLILEPTDGTE